jgi:hypothetical protein
LAFDETMASKFANSNVGPGTAPQESSCSLNQICPPARVSEAYGIRRQIASWDLASAPIFRSNLRNFTSTERGPAMKIVLGGLMLLAHSWYPWACCHDQHCHPVPCETIKAHGLGLSWNGVVFTQEMIKDSLDEQCHVCVDTVGKYRYPYCVFVPKPKPA